MTENGFVMLVEAMMEQAYKDLESKDAEVREDAKNFIDYMKKTYG